MAIRSKVRRVTVHFRQPSGGQGSWVACVRGLDEYDFNQLLASAPSESDDPVVKTVRAMIVPMMEQIAGAKLTLAGVSIRGNLMDFETPQGACVIVPLDNVAWIELGPVGDP